MLLVGLIFWWTAKAGFLQMVTNIELVHPLLLTRQQNHNNYLLTVIGKYDPSNPVMDDSISLHFCKHCKQSNSHTPILYPSLIHKPFVRARRMMLWYLGHGCPPPGCSWSLPAQCTLSYYQTGGSLLLQTFRPQLATCNKASSIKDKGETGLTIIETGLKVRAGTILHKHALCLVSVQRHLRCLGTNQLNKL